ncbi:MAG TPA: alpha-ketoacid dehydrogenase subunit beta [Fimbriimonadaceae bacterium]|nr:alpha-ketoacid dehydrogenase subunit beta [Armatimonadota bacterium]HCM73488.1 alpha-ketoacid dehydrogenase subunit beta [Armatimonadota bacterium]HRD31857.1 alpha-ketoacid dehydrogenase subunit beta [Fimbriimonadaceae bacterium]HRE94863.1 alpha-ketoacid dehydrogenase subunit beta [Fimbriimonadaceae bacterium]HRI73264.1 alpha-ketoacid dehydrogenase subunit beta [Fimbriimonadaceae bacterium]
MSQMSVVEATNAALRQELARDPKVFVYGEDVAHYGGMFRVTDGLLRDFGADRVIDTPISESGFLGMGLGAAMAGMRPVAELMFIDFSLVAMDQLLNNIAKTHYMSGGSVPVPLTIITQGGGYRGAAAQHSQMLEALLLHLPGLKVVLPSNAADAKGLLAAAIRDDNPVVFINHKQLFGAKSEVPDGEHVVPLGQARTMREGTDVTLFTYSYLVGMGMQAAEEAATQGVSVEVVDLRTLNPLDWETIAASVTKTHRVVIAHEAHLRCGVGVDLSHQIQSRLFDELDAPIQVVAALDAPIPFAKELEDVVLPSPARLLEACLGAVHG